MRALANLSQYLTNRRKFLQCRMQAWTGSAPRCHWGQGRAEGWKQSWGCPWWCWSWGLPAPSPPSTLCFHGRCPVHKPIKFTRKRSFMLRQGLGLSLCRYSKRSGVWDRQVRAPICTGRCDGEITPADGAGAGSISSCSQGNTLLGKEKIYFSGCSTGEVVIYFLIVVQFYKKTHFFFILTVLAVPHFKCVS